MAQQRKKQRPGVMLYFEFIPALACLTNEQRGRLLYAALLYAQDGTSPQIDDDPVLSALWPLVQSRADADGIKYDKICRTAQLRRRYGIYKQIQERKGEEVLPFDEWLERVDDC